MLLSPNPPFAAMARAKYSLAKSMAEAEAGSASPPNASLVRVSVRGLENLTDHQPFKLRRGVLDLFRTVLCLFGGDAR